MTTAQEWLESVRALDIERLTLFGVKAGRGKDGEEIVALPYRRNGEVYAHKVRRAGDRKAIEETGKPPFYWRPAGVPHGLFNEDALRDQTLDDQPVIVTEGEFDALAVMECGFPRTVSIPDGWSDQIKDLEGPKSKPLLDHTARIRKSPCVIVAGDNDKVGEQFVRAVFNLFEGHPVRYVTWPDGCKDANETLAKHGQAAVVKAINAARHVDPPGGSITGFSDAPPTPTGEIFTSGIQELDRVMCFHVGFPTIVTGIPATGKSTFLTWALHQVQRQHNVRIGVSLMETPWPTLQDHLCRLHTGRPYAECGSKDRLNQMLDQHWRLMHREGDSDHGMKWVKDMMWAAAVRDGCRIVVFDPWNEIEHQLLPGESVTDYTKHALTKMRQWAERYGCALCIVAHPTKMQEHAGGKPRAPLGYDISGSSTWYDKAAIGLTVHREEDERGPHTVLINWKTKFRQFYPCSEGRVRMEFDERMMVYRRRM